MKSFTILAYLYPGDGDPVTSAAFTVTPADVEFIISALRTLKRHTDDHGGYSTLHHCGDQQIDFIEEFPAGFDFGLGLDEDPYAASSNPEILPDYPERRHEFITTNNSRHICRSESTGLCISTHGGTRIRGYCKHSDRLLTSADILPALVAYMERTYPEAWITTDSIRSLVPSLKHQDP